MFNQKSTCVGDLEDKGSFCLAYYGTIRETFWFLSKNEDLTEELTQDFVFRKILPDEGLIEKYLVLLKLALNENRPRPSFRGYLIRSIRNAWNDHHRKPERKEVQHDDEMPIFELADREHAEENLDPDALYAYAILNRALHGVRNHCRKNGMDEYWTIFDELVLARLDDSRKSLTREQLRLRYFPGEKSNQKLDNILTSVKRMVYRHLKDIFVRDPFADHQDRSAAFALDDWIFELRNCDSSVHGALVAATRVTPSGNADYDFRNSVSVMEVSPPDELLEKELGFALSLRLQLPIDEWTEWRDPGEFLKLLPARSSFLPDRKGYRKSRPLTLGMIMGPSAKESEDLRYANIDEILRRVKDLARNLSRPSCHPVDQQLFKLIYTLAITIARVGFGHVITTLSVTEQQQGIWFFIRQNWVDDETKAYLKNALATPGVWYAD